MTASFVNLQMDPGGFVLVNHSFLIWVLRKRGRGRTICCRIGSFVGEVHDLSSQYWGN